MKTTNQLTPLRRNVAQFSVGTLLGLMLACCLFSGYWINKIEQIRAEASTAIKSADLRVQRAEAQTERAQADAEMRLMLKSWLMQVSGSFLLEINF